MDAGCTLIHLRTPFGGVEQGLWPRHAPGADATAEKELNCSG